MLDPWFKRTYPLKHVKKWFYWNLFERRLLKDASAVLFTCDEERQLARQSFSNSSYTERVVEFGTARPNANESSARQAFAEAFPKAAQAPFLLFMSRIHPKKGVDLLLKAYGEIQSEFPTKLPPLLIAGPCHDAAYLEELKTLAQKLCPADSVVWTGMIEGDVKWGALHSCEAFVLPSHQENFGIAVTEAMAVARPVLISDKVNIWREIVDDGGGLAATDSIQGTRQTLMHWAEMSATARAAMGAAALASFERRFEIKAVAKGLIRTVEPFLNTQAPGTQA
jgi:glycosyltransferase involved in cell wall biosynthesis